MSQTNRTFDETRQKSGQATSEITRHFQQAGQAANQFSLTLASAARSALAFVGIASAVQTLRQLGQSFLTASLAMDDARQALTAVTGSTQAARREMEFLQGIAARTGTAVTTLAQNWTGLFAATNPVPGRLEEARKVFIALTEVAPRLGKSADQVGNALYGLTQLAGGTTVQMQELQQQIGDALPGVLPALARELGKTQQELRNLIATGGLLVDDTLPALTRAIRSLAATDGPVSTLRSEFGRMRTAWTELMDTFAQAGGLTIMTKGIQLLTGYVNLLREGFQGLQFRLGLGLDEEGKLQRRLNELQTQMQNLANSMQALSKIEGFDFSQMEAQMRELNEEAVRLQKQLQTIQEPPAVVLPAVTITGPSLKLTADRMKAEEDLLKSSLQKREAAITQNFVRQRQLVEQFYQEELARQPQQLEALQAQRQADLLKLAQQEQQQLLAVRIQGAQQERDARLRTLDAEIQAASGAKDAVLKLENQRAVIIAEAEGKIAELRAQGAQDQVEAAGQVTESLAKELGKRQKAEEDFREFLLREDQRVAEGMTREHERITREIEKLHEEEVRLAEQAAERQARAYESLAEDIRRSLGDTLFDIFKGTANLWQATLDFMLRTFSQFVAQIATHTIIMPIAVQVAGGLAQGLGGGATQLLSQALGVDLGGVAGGASGIGNLFGFGRALGGAFNTLTQFLTDLPTQIGALFGLDVVGADFIGPLQGNTIRLGMSSLGASLTALAGLLGVGGGIFTALTAGGIGGQIGGVLGAAGGATALAAVIGPAIGLSLAPILGPIGLAISALAPLLGGLLQFGKRGPRLGIGDLGGLTVIIEGERLRVTGDVTSRILRAERVGGEQQIQQQLEASLTTVVQGMVDVINSVAINASGLLDSTQNALTAAFQHALVINSSSRRNFERDIREQLQFLPVQISSFFLAPLIDAFRQLETAELDQQIARLPQSTAQLIGVLNQFNTTLAELAQVQNRDVLATLGEVHDRLNQFRAQLVEATNRIAESIASGVIAAADDLGEVLAQSLQVQALSLGGFFGQRLQAIGALRATEAQVGAAGLDVSGIEAQVVRVIEDILTDAFAIASQALQRPAEQFNESLAVLLAIPDAVAALNAELAQLKLLATAFAQVVAPLQQDIARLEAAVLPLDEQLADSAAEITELRDAIADAGEAVEVALPLYDALRQAILDELALKEQQIRVQADLIQQAEQQIQQAEQQIRQAEQLSAQITTSPELTPTQQGAGLVDQLNQQISRLTEQQAAGAPPEDILATIAEINRLLEEVIQLGRETNNLVVIQQAQALQAALLPLIEAQQRAAEEQKRLAEEQKRLAEEQLLAIAGTTDIEQALLNVQAEALTQLHQIEADLQRLFISSELVQQSLGLPIPVVVVGQAAQQGAVIRAQTGRMVLTEPGEGIFLPPLTTGQLVALQAMNSAFPRLGWGGIVPGVGSGDSVPLTLPSGSFVLNRKATGVVRQGFQTGGMVDGGGGNVVHHYHQNFDFRGIQIRSKEDIRALVDAFREHLRRTGGSL